MSSNSAIEWTEATWNPIVGCTILSPGCINCYAQDEAARQIRCARGLGRNTHYAGTVKTVKGKAIWTGKLVMAPEHILLAPLKRKKPTMYFVNSMSDLFHENVPDEWIDKIFAVMALCPQHTFQVLTKRAKRMQDYFAAILAEEKAAGFANEAVHIAPRRFDLLACQLAGSPCAAGIVEDTVWPLPNVWLGVSAERQQEADERIPLLLQTPATIRFISAEPLLGPIDLRPLSCGTNALTSSTGPNLDWLITGGESGPKARPMHPDWVRSLRDQCADAKAEFFFKQWGEWAPGECANKPMTRTERTADWFVDEWNFSTVTPRVSEETHADDSPDLYRLGKKAAGRHLDGELHNAMPERTR